MTCNSNWAEIKECRAPGEVVQNRPDLVVWVFKEKLNICRAGIQMFGLVALVVHVFKFQKRGLPHAHFLVILKSCSKLLSPEAYDRFVCAELPDETEDPYLYSLVVKHMMHGPCGELNPSNVCMKDGKCKNNYPKQFSEQTVDGKGSYHVYRRRNNGHSVVVRRRRGVPIGQLCTVNPCEDERYYLRVLLLNVACPVSYEFLLTVDGVVCQTYREAAYKSGLLHRDDDIKKYMEEAPISKMPVELRMLFATLLYYCKPAKPKELFDKFYECMSEDFARKNLQRLTDDKIMDRVLIETEQITREISSKHSIQVPVEDLHALAQLNSQRRHAFHILFGKAIADEGGAFFVDGPGGTGKSFLYKVLLAHIRFHGFIALVVATSGIASSCFLKGHTAHRFKIPIDISDGVKFQVSFQSGEAYLIGCSEICVKTKGYLLANWLFLWEISGKCYQLFVAVVGIRKLVQA
ncbi:hypothetical protein LIER_40563 [Lithospermum erythrorhizon]|uniref:ATP-dependent DNA helicase n=1 Tax=Lithospermum erythrorhizon TaxID=34254 RepID=A0AAV3R021_LITER